MKKSALMFRSPFVIVLWVFLAWFIVAFLIAPNVGLLIDAFQPKPGRNAFEKLLSSDRAMRSLLNSVLLAFLLSVTVNVVGVFIALVTQYFKVAGSRILWLGYATTFLYGGVVLVTAYKSVYGAGGVFEALFGGLGYSGAWFGGLLAVAFVMTFACTTNHLLFVSAAISKIDQQVLESATMMGASEWTILRRLVLPQIKPALFATTILTFLTGLGALSAPQVIGGGFQTISPMILTFSNTQTSRDLAALLALFLGAVTVVMLAIMNRLEASGTYYSLTRVATPLAKRPIANPVGNAIVHALAWLLFVIYAIPVVVVVIFSFLNGSDAARGTLGLHSVTIDNYVRVLSGGEALRPFLVSVAYAGATALIVILIVGVPARFVQKFRNTVTSATEYLLHIPWVLPGTMIALGLLLTYNAPNPLIGGMVLTGTVFILLVSYVVGKIPFTLRMMKAAYAGVNVSMEESAQIMGASTFTVFRRILFPAVLPVAAAITALNFNGLLDDYDTAVFLAHPSFQPLGLVIAAQTMSEVNLDAQANVFVYTVLLMLITGLIMWLVYGRLLKEPSAAPARRGLPKRRAAREVVEPATGTEVVR